MSTFQKTVFTVVLATAFAGAPAISYGFKICDGNGQNCIEFNCLPADKITLQPSPETDTCLKLLKAPQRYQGTSSRKEVLKRVSDGCINAGGVLEDKGSGVTCTLAAKPVAKPAAKQKADCETRGGVWAGEDGKGECTGPRRK